MTEEDSKIIILTSQTTDLHSTLINTDDEFKDPSDREWPVSIVNELERLTKEKEELMKLTEEIDKQPVINLNERLSRRKKKEDKLPRKLRAGWK